MTKKLEDLLNMDESKEIIKQAEKQEKDQTKHEIAHEESFRNIAEFDKIASALPAVKGLGLKADEELEDIATRALTAYEDLMDLGMNVESRYSGRVFEVAGGLLKTGLDAKVAKLNNKLKIVELQLKKEKMDKEGGNSSDDGMISGAGYVVTDRNSLLQRLKGLDNDK
jgi:hypothetical protein|tara:strand:+ start:720 stop:1223 length:504 start_codon:yes stop_codon:yes gene_type:complete